MKLNPGEKAHFVVGSGATYDWALINQVRNDPSGRLKSMLDIPLVKGQEIRSRSSLLITRNREAIRSPYPIPLSH